MKIFLIEDEPAVQSYIVAILKKAGHLVETEQKGTTAFQRYCKEGPFDLVLTNLEHKGMNGIELIHAIREKNHNQRMSIVTGWPVLQKPFRAKKLLDFIESSNPTKP